MIFDKLFGKKEDNTLDKSFQNHVDILDYLRKKYSDRIDNAFSYKKSCPTIPELSAEAPYVIHQLLQDLISYYTDRGRQTDMNVCGTWSFLAGMGATKLWDKDWPTLKEQGIYESLSEPKGVLAMDEYVLDLLGIHYEPDQHVPFTDNIYAIVREIEDEVYFSMNTIDESAIFKRMMDLHISLYNFGMIYEMFKLGMK